MQTRAKWYPTGYLLADLVVTLKDFSAARLVSFWLLVSGLKALLMLILGMMPLPLQLRSEQAGLGLLRTVALFDCSSTVLSILVPAHPLLSCCT